VPGSGCGVVPGGAVEVEVESGGRGCIRGGRPKIDVHHDGMIGDCLAGFCWPMLVVLLAPGRRTLHVASLYDGARPVPRGLLQRLHTTTRNHSLSLHHCPLFFLFFSLLLLLRLPNPRSPRLHFHPLHPASASTPDHIPRLIALRSLNARPLIVIALPDHVAARPRSTSSQLLRSI
jgi:hypothetical protein